MRFIRALALLISIFVVFPFPLWAQTFNEGSEYKTISPRAAARSRLPKWMRDAKPMPLPSIPENSQPHYEGPRNRPITPRVTTRSRLPKWMRDAKPMPLPTIPEGYQHSMNEKVQNAQK